jgi:3-oxoadipate enol-lactonase
MAISFIERMAVEVDGQGDPVVMIHGLGGTTNTWAPLMPAFARYQTIRLDLPGSGRSHKVEGELSCERFVKAVIRVMGALGIERAHVVAHSMGTIVAAHLAAYEPKMVRSLALFGPLLAPPDGARAALTARGDKARLEGVIGMQAIADALVLASTASETKRSRLAASAFVRESLMGQCPDGYSRSCQALAGMIPANTGQITCPTLLVTGDEDIVAPPSSVRAMGDKIAGAKIEIIRSCGHWTPVETPEACIAHLNRFYAAQNESSKAARLTRSGTTYHPGSMTFSSGRL